MCEHAAESRERDRGTGGATRRSSVSSSRADAVPSSGSGAFLESSRAVSSSQNAVKERKKDLTCSGSISVYLAPLIPNPGPLPRLNSRRSADFFFTKQRKNSSRPI